jgi:hypothetical protein
MLTASTSLGKQSLVPIRTLFDSLLSTFASVYSFSLFLPTIIRDLGHKNEKAQLMTVPPYVVACFFCILTGYMADRLRTRGVVMIGFNVVGIIGLIMLLTSSSPEVKYAGTFFYAVGVYPNVPQCMVSNPPGGASLHFLTVTGLERQQHRRVYETSNEPSCTGNDWKLRRRTCELRLFEQGRPTICQWLFNSHRYAHNVGQHLYSHDHLLSARECTTRHKVQGS